MSRSKKKLSERSPAGRLGVVALIAAASAVVGKAERDLQRRPAEDVRGSKTLWRLVCLNALGAAAYLRWGRRSAAS